MPRKLLRRWLPSPERIRQVRVLAWLGPSLHHPRLWHVSREGIALGLALGVFFGLLIPFGQIPAACALAIALRANLPMAAVGTLITNPFTFAPIYYCAWRIGTQLLGVDMPVALTEEAFEAGAEAGGWVSVWSGRIMALGKPLLAGLALMAIVLSVASYFAVHGLWRLSTLRAWRRRSWARGRQTPNTGKPA